MTQLMKSFWSEEDALGTVEMVLLLACLVAIAILFKDTVSTWVQDNIDKALSGQDIGGEGGKGEKD